MKIHRALSLFSAFAGIATAAPDAALETGAAVAGKPLEILIRELSDDQFRVREEASRRIWMIGERALAALQEIEAGKDPEQAYRARELIRKIQLHITPETDPTVIELVERYAKATPNEKLGLFDRMHKKRAWRQILKLYAGETNAELQARLQRMIEGIAVTAARESLLKDDVASAREFLEMAPADAAGLLALADFHRGQGTLETELERAEALEGVRGAAWRLALHRAAGNLEAARGAAEAAGETKISLVMSALLGDPLPWLHQNETGTNGGAIHQPYSELAAQRWQGKALRPQDLEPLLRGVKSGNRAERQNAVNTLFLLGEPAAAEQAYRKDSPLDAFSYFDLLENIPAALETLGLDAANPDYQGWVLKRIKRLAGEDDAEEEDGMPTDSPELLLLANFLEKRGLHGECADAFLGPLATLAVDDTKVFTELLAVLFGTGSGNAGQADAAPRLARTAAVAWAGENAERWEEVIIAAFGEELQTVELWDWLAELDPKADRAARLDGMLALYGMGRDPLRLRDKWLALAWAAHDKAPVEKQGEILARLAIISDQSLDATASLRIRDALPDADRSEGSQEKILALTAAGRWEEAAEYYLAILDGLSRSRQDPSLGLHAAAASCLRQAGRAAEATAQDKLVDELALGNNALEIASGYAIGYDYRRATDWWNRAARQSDPSSEYFELALRYLVPTLLERGKWREAGAVSEVRAQLGASVDAGGEMALARLNLRLQADLGRGLAVLKTDRAGAISILANCHKMFPSDGSLADDFFPALREVGLIKEHDEWFEISWARMSAVVARFPAADNTLNTAAWLASRANRRLNEAERLEERALAMHPDQSAYLDTMAEIQFAKGKRGKAVEWSTRAVNFMPLDSLLRRQHERFLNGPLPR